MGNRNEILKALSIFLLGAFFMSCSPKYNPHNDYPEFSSQLNSFKKPVLMIDVLVKENKEGFPLDYDRQIFVAESFHEEFVERALTVGIKFNETFYGSTGLFWDAGSLAPVFDYPNKQGEIIDSVEMVPSPIFLSESLEKDLLFQEELRYTIVDTVNWEKEMEAPYYPEDVLFLVIIEGLNTPIGKQFGQGLLTGLATLGTYSSYQTSGLTGKLFVFDRETGKLIWFSGGQAQADLANGRCAKILAKVLTNSLSRRKPYRP